MALEARIIGIGQPSAGDDGVGLLVAHELHRTPLARIADIHEIFEPLQLIDLLQDRDLTVIVDALIVEDKIGQVMRLDRNDLLRSPLLPLSSHSVSVSQAIDLAERLSSSHTMPDIHIVGIGITRPIRYSKKMSPQIVEAVPHAIKTISQIFGI